MIHRAFHRFSVVSSLFAILWALAGTISPAYAFNKERCGSLFPKSDDAHPPHYAPIYIFTMFPSTTSYFSSLGPCSMYGDARSVHRAQFIEHSLFPLQVDASRGQGEYLNSLAQLSGCPSEKYAAFAKVIHHKIEEVFPANGTSSLELLRRIDSTIQNDSELSSACQGG